MNRGVRNSVRLSPKYTSYTIMKKQETYNFDSYQGVLVHGLILCKIFGKITRRVALIEVMTKKSETYTGCQR